MGSSTRESTQSLRGFIRNPLEYASSSWWPWLPQTKRNRLERVQNGALRSITRLYKTCPIDFLRLEANIEPLYSRMVKNDQITRDRFMRLPDTDPRSILLKKEVPMRLSTRFGWRHESGLGHLEVLKRETTTPPLKAWSRFPNTEVDEVVLSKKKAEYSEEELKLRTMEKILSIEADFRIYTDGSTSGSQVNGGAGIYIEDANGNEVYEQCLPAGQLCSSYSGECVAMLHALEWIVEQGGPESVLSPKDPGERSFLICTDSKSLTSAIDKNNWKDKDPWLKKIKETLQKIEDEITVLWIPSHCDVGGNEKADELAKQGTLMDQHDTPVTHRIVKAKIKAARWRVEHERAIQTYGERRSPRLDIEEKWPRRVRTLYVWLRTQHSMELRWFTFHKLGVIDDPLCQECGAEETIEHVLCKCPALLEECTRQWNGDVKIGMMVTEPEVWQKDPGKEVPMPQNQDNNER